MFRSYHVDKYYDDMNMIDCDCEIWYHPQTGKDCKLNATNWKSPDFKKKNDILTKANIF